MTRLASRQPVTLIGGAPLDSDDLSQALALAPVVAAADGGADTALANGLVPQAVWGDFDSISARARAGIPPENLPPLVLRAIIFDSFLVLCIIAFRRRKQIIAWWQARRQSSSGVLARDESLSSAP